MIKELNDSNFAEVTSQGVVMVDFWAVWCGPCRALAPHVEAIAEEYEGRVVVGKLDIEASEKVAMELGIRAIPTIIFFKNGEIVDRTTGLVNKKVLAEKLDALLA
ncbi:MAG: thioredoxin [Bacteroidales bacterium]|jgi:thioredoxin 1|nr:thioredoxin [Bacteroidales bacterium]MBP5420742.1 thioredoxin [Bacteroidales bacterium]MCR5697425.1 thioredoxin [Marinilabiliaceae bacterium]